MPLAMLLLLLPSAPPSDDELLWARRWACLGKASVRLMVRCEKRRRDARKMSPRARSEEGSKRAKNLRESADTDVGLVRRRSQLGTLFFRFHFRKEPLAHPRLFFVSTSDPSMLFCSTLFGSSERKRK